MIQTLEAFIKSLAKVAANEFAAREIRRPAPTNALHDNATELLRDVVNEG